MSSLSSSALTLHIRTDTSDVEWSVRQDELTFGNAMFAIAKVLPNVAVTAFEYEDDEGDRITVRTDEELQTMLAAYLEECIDGYKPVLAIYPRVGKTPQDRNIHGLKINTKKSSGSTPPSSERPMQLDPAVSMVQSSGISPASTGPSPGRSNAGTKAGGAGIQGIVGCGDIVDTDLRYIEVVGSGYSGTVYRAHHIPSNRIMAVKVLQLDITEEVQKEILSELRILDQCHSPCIINFYGAFFIENQFSICTEYMDGRSLDHYGKIPEPVLARMTVNIVSGLLYLWARKIMHRDIKPSNVLVNTQGQVKLCDFGVSTQLVNSIAKTYVGTYAYMAPERIKGEDYSLLAEVWSLGVSLFELATGRFPYSLTKSNNNEVMMPLLNCIVNEPPPKLTEGIFSVELVDLISKCMHRNPRARLTPVALESHPFITKHFATQDDIIAMWVQSKLKEITPHSSAVTQR